MTPEIYQCITGILFVNIQYNFTFSTYIINALSQILALGSSATVGTFLKKWTIELKEAGETHGTHETIGN